MAVVTHPSSPRTTTGATVYGDLVDSLVARGAAVSYGRTWGSLKAALDALGVKDDDWIGSIEIGVKQGGRGVVMKDDIDGLVEVREL